MQQFSLFGGDVQIKNVKSVLNTEELHLSIESVVEQVTVFQRRLNDWSPRKSNLRWFGLGRYQAQISLVFKSTEDVSNHAAAMVG